MKLWRKPLDADKWEAPKGRIYIIEDRCKGCNFCIEFCPRKVLEESEKFNSKGYHPPDVVNPDECVDCQLCELICPEFAIYVVDAKAEEQEKAEEKQEEEVGTESQKKDSGKKAESGGTI